PTRPDGRRIVTRRPGTQSPAVQSCTKLASGTHAAPFATLSRARTAAREAAPKMDADIVVSLAPGVYRLDATLELTEADSGRNGHRVIYRSAARPGQARILGSVPLTGWQEHRDLRVSGCG
ncbi:MAG: hypothetical protein U1E05_20185, partial [Patescibacteria group bacterium]|nr:hypothetical protein [Patescibacteria group bacterium]